MNLQELVDRAREIIRSHGLEDEIEVDDPSVEGNPLDAVVKTENGTWVKSWVFVPNKR